MREHLQNKTVSVASTSTSHVRKCPQQLIQAAHPSIKEEHQALAASPWLDSRNHSQKKVRQWNRKPLRSRGASHCVRLLARFLTNFMQHIQMSKFREYMGNFCVRSGPHTKTMRVRPRVTAKLPVLRPWFWTLILLKHCAHFLPIYCLLGRSWLQASFYWKTQNVKVPGYLSNTCGLHMIWNMGWRIVRKFFLFPCRVHIFKQWNPLLSRPSTQA